MKPVAGEETQQYGLYATLVTCPTCVVILEVNQKLTCSSDSNHPQISKLHVNGNKVRITTSQKNLIITLVWLSSACEHSQ